MLYFLALVTSDINHIYEKGNNVKENNILVVSKW